MLKKRSNQSGAVTDIGELFANALGEFFAPHQRTSGNAGTFGMTPNQLVGIQIRCVTRQEVQG
jgi:hypothetical protein